MPELVHCSFNNWLLWVQPVFNAVPTCEVKSVDATGVQPNGRCYRFTHHVCEHHNVVVVWEGGEG